MPQVMRRLLSTYEFLDDAVRKHGKAMTADRLAALQAEREDVFRGMLTHQSADAGVTHAQLSYVMKSLADLIEHSSQAEELKSLCASILERHRKNIARVHASTGRKQRGGQRRAEPDWRSFDHIADRVGIFDRDYRYVYTNAANAQYHGKSQEEFVGKLGWRMVGRQCFDNYTKPFIDSAFAGERRSQFTGHTWAGSKRTWFVSADPVRGSDGEVAFVVVICKDVSQVPIPPENIVMLPTKWATIYSRNKAAAVRRMRNGN